MSSQHLLLARRPCSPPTFPSSPFYSLLAECGLDMWKAATLTQSASHPGLLDSPVTLTRKSRPHSLPSASRPLPTVANLDMRFLNGYQPPAPLPEAEYHLDTPPEGYDLNCCYWLPEEAALKTDGVKLVPIIVRPSRLLARSPGGAHHISPTSLDRNACSPPCTLVRSTTSSLATLKATSTSPTTSPRLSAGSSRSSRRGGVNRARYSLRCTTSDCSLRTRTRVRRGQRGSRASWGS